MTPVTDDRPDMVRVENIAKSFGAVTALEDVSLNVQHGEVLGLIGDNGAGKSTLIKILSGFIQPDRGRILIDGKEVRLRSVSHAREEGVETVYQDLALVSELPVWVNLHLNKEIRRKGTPLLNKKLMRQRARSYLDDMGINIPSVNADIAYLSGGQRQAIAVARSVYSAPKLLLLDEPLAAMGAKEGAIILSLVKMLKERGVSIIVIAHNFSHVMDVCDRVCLLQQGRITYNRQTSESSVEELVELVASEYRVAGGASARGRLLTAPAKD